VRMSPSVIAIISSTSEKPDCRRTRLLMAVSR
jgi:hypothetical protein